MSEYMFLKVNRTRINFVFDSILKTYATFSDATFEVRFLFSDFYLWSAGLVTAFSPPYPLNVFCSF